MMKICELIDVSYNLEVLGITDDSRLVKKNYIFVATKGYNVDHYDYIGDAIKNGAVFVVSDRKINYDIPNIIVNDINNYYVKLCEKFYDINMDEFNLIGITGTDGKTTTATIVKELIGTCAYLGTNGLTIKDKTISTNNTTPCVSELYLDLARVEKSKIKNISMEVSSEALLHGRVNNFKYKVIGFTNITGDHLNIHKSFKNYVDCKLKLLDLLKEDGVAFLNGDDDNLKNVTGRNIYKYGFDDSNDYVITITDSKYMNITIKHNEEIYKLQSPLKGIYNVYNVVLAFLIGLSFGVDRKLLVSRIKGLKPISGRCEFLNFGQDFDIVLDYAHTINGIKNILETFKSYDEIITVTGAAGGREKEKRSVIGKIVMDNSDISIFTMDDPRYESVDDIIDDMVGDSKDYIRIINRKEAINYALSIASIGSVVLILGKGRDNYMAIGDKKIKYNDYDVIKNYFDD